MSREFSLAHFSSSFHYLLTYYCASIFLLIYWGYDFFILFFSPPNAHLINSQAAFYTKSPSFNIFLLTRSLKKELLSFKISFFPEFYLFNHQTIHPEIGQCECLPLKLPETERSVLPAMLRNVQGWGPSRSYCGHLSLITGNTEEPSSALFISPSYCAALKTENKKPCFHTFINSTVIHRAPTY